MGVPRESVTVGERVMVRLSGLGLPDEVVVGGVIETSAEGFELVLEAPPNLGGQTRRASWGKGGKVQIGPGSGFLERSGLPDPPTTVIRTYQAKQQSDAIRDYQSDVERMARLGYEPADQSWAPGQWGAKAFVVSALLFVVLIGILVFFYLLIVKPDGTLTVTYRLVLTVSDPELDATKACPRCAETIKAAAVVCRYCGHEFLQSSSPDPPR